jgi:hypothetical protein
MAHKDVVLLLALRRVLKREIRQTNEDCEIAWGVQVDRAVRQRQAAAKRTDSIFKTPPGKGA